MQNDSRHENKSSNKNNVTVVISNLKFSPFLGEIHLPKIYFYIKVFLKLNSLKSMYRDRKDEILLPLLLTLIYSIDSDLFLQHITARPFIECFS